MLMKRLCWILLGSFWLGTVSAQGTLKITGNTYLKGSSDVSLVAQDMNLENNGTLLHAPGDMRLVWSGTTNSQLWGSGTTTLDRLLLQKAGGGLKLQKHTLVLGGIQFSGGLLDLDNYKVDLGATGLLTGESETSRAFTTGSGYLQRTQWLNAPNGSNPGNLGALITSGADLGTTVIKRGHTPFTVATGINSIQRYFDISPANNSNLAATLRFHYFDAERGVSDETRLSLFKSQEATTWTNQGTSSKDGAANYVEQSGIAAFSRWTLASVQAITITPPAPVVVNTDAGTCTALVSLTGSKAATANGVPTPTLVYKIGDEVIGTTHTFPKGSTTVTVLAANGVAPDAWATFTVTVQDREAPVITACPANRALCYSNSGTYSLPALLAFDNCGTPTVSFTISQAGAVIRSGNSADASGSFPVGTSIIQWRVSDPDGNSTECETTVTIASAAVVASIADAYAIPDGAAANTVYIGYKPASSLTLTGEVSGGTGPYQYKWTTGSSTGSPLSKNRTFSVSPTSPTTYYLNVTDANGCDAAAVTRLVQVKEVRCGPRGDKVMVCVLQKGSYTNACLRSNEVSAALSGGGYLGECVVATTKTAADKLPEIGEAGRELRVQAVPNPSQSVFTLITSGNGSEPLTLRILDAVGRQVELKRNQPATGTMQVGRHYRPGVYYAEVVQGKERVVLKLIKQAN